MTCLRRSVAVVLLLAACQFKTVRGMPDDADVDVDAPDDAKVDTPPDTPVVPWLHPWKRRKEITLLASQIEAPGDTALTDFPVLISVTDPQLATTAQMLGTDIVFTTDNAMSPLQSEIESFTKSSGQLVAWVKIPTLSATTDTKIFMYYGHSSPPARTPEMVWTADYYGVWHLQQDPSSGAGAGNMKDATSGDRDATAFNLETTDSVAARIGRGVQLNGMDEFLDLGQLNLGNEFTISMWINWSGGGPGIKALMANSVLGGDTDGFRFFINTNATQDRRVIFETGNGQGGSARTAQTNMNAVTPNVPAHVAVVVNRAGSTATIYINSMSAAATTTSRNDFENNAITEAAQMRGGTLNYPGTLDEIQISTTQRSPEWLRTSFNNQNNPGNFHTLRDEELEP
jgi:hypothetical protein